MNCKRRPEHVALMVKCSGGGSIGIAKPALTRSIMTTVLKRLMSRFS